MWAAPESKALFAPRNKLNRSKYVRKSRPGYPVNSPIREEPQQKRIVRHSLSTADITLICRYFNLHGLTMISENLPLPCFRLWFFLHKKKKSHFHFGKWISNFDQSGGIIFWIIANVWKHPSGIIWTDSGKSWYVKDHTMTREFLKSILPISM